MSLPGVLDLSLDRKCKSLVRPRSPTSMSFRKRSRRGKQTGARKRQIVVTGGDTHSINAESSAGSAGPVGLAASVAGVPKDDLSGALPKEGFISSAINTVGATLAVPVTFQNVKLVRQRTQAKFGRSRRRKPGGSLQDARVQTFSADTRIPSEKLPKPMRKKGSLASTDSGTVAEKLRNRLGRQKTSSSRTYSKHDLKALKATQTFRTSASAQARAGKVEDLPMTKGKEEFGKGQNAHGSFLPREIERIKEAKRLRRKSRVTATGPSQTFPGYISLSSSTPTVSRTEDARTRLAMLGEGTALHEEAKSADQIDTEIARSPFSLAKTENSRTRMGFENNLKFSAEEILERIDGHISTEQETRLRLERRERELHAGKQRCKSAKLEAENQISSTREKFDFYSELHVFFVDVCSCLEAKTVMIEDLTKAHRQVTLESTEWARKAITNDLIDTVDSIVNSCDTLPEVYKCDSEGTLMAWNRAAKNDDTEYIDEFGRSSNIPNQNKTGRESRKAARLRRWVSFGEDVGASINCMEPTRKYLMRLDPDVLERLQPRRNSVLAAGELIFSDARLEFQSAREILRYFIQWERQFPEDFAATYTRLAMPELLAPYMNLALLQWRPGGEEGLEILVRGTLYGSISRVVPNSTTELVLAALVEKCAVPHMIWHLKNVWDPDHVESQLIWNTPLKLAQDLRFVLRMCDALAQVTEWVARREKSSLNLRTILVERMEASVKSIWVPFFKADDPQAAAEKLSGAGDLEIYVIYRSFVRVLHLLRSAVVLLPLLGDLAPRLEALLLHKLGRNLLRKVIGPGQNVVIRDKFECALTKFADINVGKSKMSETELWKKIFA